MEEEIKSEISSFHEERLKQNPLENLNKSQNSVDWGVYGYQDELGLIGYKGSQNDNPDFEIMSKKDTRDAVVREYYSKLDERMRESFTDAQELRFALNRDLNEDTRFWNGEVQLTRNINKYTQGGFLVHVRELSYDRSRAEVNAQRHNTKTNRKRKEKRDKLMEKHLQAVIAAGDAAYEQFKYKSKFVDEQFSKYEHMALADTLKTSLTAKKKLVAALKDAEEYDIENNIKMVRNKDNKREIDMGDGTTKFFQKLAKIRMDHKLITYKKMLMTDRDLIKSHLPEKEARRYSQKMNQEGISIKESEDKMKSDIASIARRIPDLICALDKDEDKAILMGKVSDFIASKDISKKLALIDKIMSNARIMMCIRKDLRDEDLTASLSKEAAAEEIKTAFLEIANSEEEIPLGNVNENSLEGYLKEKGEFFDF